MRAFTSPSKRAVHFAVSQCCRGPSPRYSVLAGHPAFFRSVVEVQRRAASSSPSAGTDATSKGDALDFTNAKAAFNSKGNLELLRTVVVFRTCAIGIIVKNCDALYNWATKVLGKTLVHGTIRYSFFNHFCAGETSTDIIPKMTFLRGHGIGGILDYAAEAKEDELPEAEVVPNSSDEVIGAPLSSRRYDYQGEAVCDANAKIFLDAVRAVKDATPEGFAAIKLSGLGNPVLLQRMSTLLFELTVFFKNLSVENVNIRPGKSLEDVVRGTPYHCIDRSFQLDYDAFSKGWKRFFVNTSEEDIRRQFEAIDLNQDGLIDYLEWSSSIRLSEINAMVGSCTQEGPLSRAALDEEEIMLYRNMCDRVQKILDLAQELEVRVMVDAEWMDIQPAIDHIVLFLQRIYNHGHQPIVFQTYQTYLKGMETKVKRDLDRSRREGWRFGAKVVRGAYMVSERKKAGTRGVESPICETYEDTEVEFHASVDTILQHKALESAPPLLPGGIDGPGRTAAAEVLVATHNRTSIERTLAKIKEFNANRDRVYFGQLLGMADHLTFTLGANGYKAYKYVPYGPIGEVMPYLIRRTQENSAILGSAGVQEERKMVTKELFRRLNPLRS